jgi:hypothetical protein
MCYLYKLRHYLAKVTTNYEAFQHFKVQETEAQIIRVKERFEKSTEYFITFNEL